jgi:hypothetical protein
MKFTHFNVPVGSFAKILKKKFAKKNDLCGKVGNLEGWIKKYK